MLQAPARTEKGTMLQPSCKKHRACPHMIIKVSEISEFSGRLNGVSDKSVYMGGTLTELVKGGVRPWGCHQAKKAGGRGEVYTVANRRKGSPNPSYNPAFCPNAGKLHPNPHCLHHLFIGPSVCKALHDPSQ